MCKIRERIIDTLAMGDRMTGPPSFAAPEGGQP